jgi:hypothetical protein
MSSKNAVDEDADEEEEEEEDDEIKKDVSALQDHFFLINNSVPLGILCVRSINTSLH